MSSKILFFIPRDIPEEKDNPREKLSQKEKIIKKLNNINITENLLLKIEQISQSKKPLQNAKKDYWNILLAKITTQIDKFPSEGEAGFYLQKVFVINDLNKLLSSSKDLENWTTKCHDSIPDGITSRCKTLQIPVEKINLLYNDVVLEYFKLDINNIKNNNDHTNNNNNNNSNNNNNYNNHIHNNNNNHQNNHDLDNNYNQEETYNQELDNLFSCEINSNLANYSYDYFSQGFDPINSYNYNNDHNNNNISQNILYDPNKNYNNNTNNNNNNHDLDNNYNQEETYNQEPDNILPCKINAILANYIFQNYTSDHFDPQAFDPINSYNYNNDHNNYDNNDHNNYNNNDHNNYNNNDHNNYNNNDHNNYNNNDHNNYNNDDHNFIHSQPRKMRKIDDITQLSIDEFYSKEILVVMNKEDTKSSIFYEKMSSTTGDFIVPAATPNVPPQCGALDRNATSL